MPGEHHVLPAQQDAAALGLLEEGGLRRALQADPLVAAKHLILDVSGVAGEVVVQPVGGNSGQSGPLGQGGVFQFTVRDTGTEREFSLYACPFRFPPQKLKYRNGLLVLPTTYAVESTSSTSTAATRVTVCLCRAFQSFSMSGVQHRMLTATSTP